MQRASFLVGFRAHQVRQRLTGCSLVWELREALGQIDAISNPVSGTFCVTQPQVCLHFLICKGKKKVYQFAKAAIAKQHRISHSSGSQKSKIRVSAGWFLLRSLLLCFQRPPSCCVCTWSPLCLCCPCSNHLSLNTHQKYQIRTHANDPIVT